MSAPVPAATIASIRATILLVQQAAEREDLPQPRWTHANDHLKSAEKHLKDWAKALPSAQDQPTSAYTVDCGVADGLEVALARATTMKVISWETDTQIAASMRIWWHLATALCIVRSPLGTPLQQKRADAKRTLSKHASLVKPIWGALVAAGADTPGAMAAALTASAYLTLQSERKGSAYSVPLPPLEPETPQNPRNMLAETITAIDAATIQTNRAHTVFVLNAASDRLRSALRCLPGT